MASKGNDGGSSNKRRPRNLMDRNAFMAKICNRGKPACALHINLDGQIGVTSMGYGMSGASMTAVTPKPTFDLMAEELHKFISANSIEGAVIGLVTDEHVSEFVKRFAHRLFESQKLKDVKYTLYNIGISYDSLMINSSVESASMLSMPYDPMEDPSDGRKRLGQLSNWRVPPFFHDEVCALSKTTFTLSISLNGAIRVAGSGLEKVIEISPKPTFDLTSEELHKLICDHSVEGCIVGILGGHDKAEAQFLESFTHRLFQTGKMKEVKYTFHRLERRNNSKA